MHKTLTIARMTFLLACRKGMLVSVLLIVAGVAAFIFFVSTGDKNLINELQLRIQYSYVLTYSLLTLIMISVSCFAVRSEIDGKQMHLLTSMPIKRAEIWLGKWLGLVIFAMIAEAVLLSTIAISSWIYCRSYAVDKVAAAKQVFGIVRYENFPVTADEAALTRERINQLILAGRLRPEEIDKETWKEINYQVRRQERLVPPTGEKVWKFNLHGKPTRGEYVELKYRFYAENRRNPVSGIWQISAPGKVESYQEAFDVFPFEFNTIKIPIHEIPDSGKFEVRLVNATESELIVSARSGLRVYHQDGAVYNNFIKAFGTQLIHLSITIAVGLTAGVAFTFSVASFFSIVLYLISISSAYFSEVATELTQGYSISVIDTVMAFVINIGLWLVKGLSPPEIITRVSSGISIPLQNLVMTWLPAIMIYGLITIALGIFLLSQKELDKIPS